MDKYEERVSKILEKKKNLDARKKRKRKTLMQCIFIMLISFVAITVLVVLPKKADIVSKPENTTLGLSETATSDISSELNTAISSTRDYSETTDSYETAKSTENTETTLKPFIPLPNDSVGGGGDNYIDPYTTKYRRIYYSSIRVCFAELVSDEEYDEWIKQYHKKYPTGDGLFEEGEKIVEPERMKIVDFILYFNIPREEFEEANNTWCHRMIKWGDVPVMNPKDYKEQEEFEVYNVDIIYTFDDEIINEYYERGEYPFDTEDEYLEAIKYHGYVTQTEEIIMLEGFETVTLPALPPDAEPTYIDFDWRSKRCK